MDAVVFQGEHARTGLFSLTHAFETEIVFLVGGTAAERKSGVNAIYVRL